ncbi:phosphopantothenate--cysteine ligase [Streptococcus halichoeri]|uniref:phosphopantothenate--cysteine ligase n=1 Tax=Streptococcus halichoeri TaxID=254785 RepID=UPI0013573581|nr:phosphopantothenate--cysteine ligase [Streptococcus halichoeri]
MKILITSGGTSEAIDSVRSITNHASGRLGALIAERFLAKGHEVTLVTTTRAYKPQGHDHLHIILVTDVASLQAQLEPLVKTHDVLIHSMAVSDYSPIYMTDLEDVKKHRQLDELLHHSNSEAKISSSADYQVLFLKRTPKIISLVKSWNPKILLVGFKLLVNVPQEELITVARHSLTKNHADYIVANDLRDITDDQHLAYLVDQSAIYPAKTKHELANLIYQKVITHD